MVEYIDQRIAGAAAESARPSREISDLLNKEFNAGQISGMNIIVNAPQQLLQDYQAEKDRIKTANGAVIEEDDNDA